MKNITINFKDSGIEVKNRPKLLKGENNASQIVANLFGGMQQYKYVIVFKNNDEEPYHTLNITPVNNQVIYIIPNSVLTEKGKLNIDIHAIDAVTETEIKSGIIELPVYDSLDNGSSTPPEPFIPWYTTANQKAAEALQSAVDAADSAASAAQHEANIETGMKQSTLTFDWTTGAVLLDGTLNNSNLTSIRTGISNIEAEAKLSISFNGPHMLRIAEYDVNGVFKKITTGTYITTDTDVVLEYPKAAFGLLINGSAPVTIAEASKLTIKKTSDLYADLKKNIKSIGLENKTVVTFGDSIMHGDGNGGYGIGDFLNERHGITLYDYSVGGASCQYIDGLNHIVAQVQQAISAGVTPNLIIVNGASNDIASSSSVEGTITESFDYVSKGYASFIDGLEYIFGLLKNTFPSVPVVYFLPHSTPSRTYTRELSYVNDAKAICKKWSVLIADVYSDGNLNARIASQKSMYCDSGGTHPNRAGYLKAYIPLIEEKIRIALAK